MEIARVILDSIIILLGLCYAFYKSYFQEKGKNLATQQDIGKITTLVEDIKKQNSDNSEYLKSRLSLYNQNFSSIKTLERNALIEINTKYSEWLNSLHTFSLVYYSYDNFENLKSMDLFFNSKNMAFNVAEDNLHLYAHDAELMNKKKELTVLTYELQGIILTKIFSFISNCEDYKNVRTLAPKEELSQLNTEYHNRQRPIIDCNMADTQKLYMEIYNHQIEFIKILNYKIYNLIDE